MSLYTPSYLTAALREDGLDGSLSAVGSINDLIDTLAHLESMYGTADFQRRFEMNRRSVLSTAIDLMRNAKGAAAQTGETMSAVLRTAQGMKVALGTIMVIIFVGVWSGIVGGLFTGLGVTIVLGGLAWYFWPTLKMFVGSWRDSNRGYQSRGWM